ncbi:MAG: EsaB/YukD family protein [Lachnospiraceae bacterium]|nr:EsaB/YukD family protein [Lachnospiraceae bacterium]
MILIEVQVPALDGSYDFECIEQTRVDKLIEEMISLIEEKEKLPCKDRTERYLYIPEQRRFLKMDEELGKQGIKSGDRLVLI